MSSSSPLAIRHKAERSQDSGACLDWSSDGGSPTRKQSTVDLDFHSHVEAHDFVTVVNVEGQHQEDTVEEGSFVTVLSIGSEVASDEGCPSSGSSADEGLSCRVSEDSCQASSASSDGAQEDHGNAGEEVLVYRLPGERLGFGLKFEGGTQSRERVRRLFVQSCAPDSPAWRARCSWGSLGEGDRITAIDGVPVTDLTRLDCVSRLKDSQVVLRLNVLPAVPAVLISDRPAPLVVSEIVKTPPSPPPVPPRCKTPRAPKPPPREAPPAEPLPPIPRQRQQPPQPEVYLDLLSQEDEELLLLEQEGESDADTSSSISTVVGCEPTLDMAKVLGPFERLERELFQADTVDALSLSDDEQPVQPPENFQDTTECAAPKPAPRTTPPTSPASKFGKKRAPPPPPPRATPPQPAPRPPERLVTVAPAIATPPSSPEPSPCKLDEQFVVAEVPQEPPNTPVETPHDLNRMLHTIEEEAALISEELSLISEEDEISIPVLEVTSEDVTSDNDLEEISEDFDCRDDLLQDISIPVPERTSSAQETTCSSSALVSIPEEEMTSLLEEEVKIQEVTQEVKLIQDLEIEEFKNESEIIKEEKLIQELKIEEIILTQEPEPPQSTPEVKLPEEEIILKPEIQEQKEVIIKSVTPKEIPTKNLSTQENKVVVSEVKFEVKTSNNTRNNKEKKKNKREEEKMETPKVKAVKCEEVKCKEVVSPHEVLNNIDGKTNEVTFIQMKIKEPNKKNKKETKIKEVKCKVVPAEKEVATQLDEEKEVEIADKSVDMPASCEPLMSNGSCEDLPPPLPPPLLEHHKKVSTFDVVISSNITPGEGEDTMDGPLSLPLFSASHKLNGDMNGYCELSVDDPPPSFSRLPPDGHEFPPSYMEPSVAPPVLSRRGQDEKSQRSVRDKIALFSCEQDQEVLIKEPTLTRFCSSEDVSRTISSIISPEMQVPPAPARFSTLPRKQAAPYNQPTPQVTRALSFSQRSQSLLDVSSRPLTALLEQRRRGLSKLRGLVIPERPETVQPTIEMPEIRSRELLHARSRPSVEVRVSASSTQASPPLPASNSHLLPALPSMPKYSPAFKRKPFSLIPSEEQHLPIKEQPREQPAIIIKQQQPISFPVKEQSVREQPIIKPPALPIREQPIIKEQPSMVLEQPHLPRNPPPLQDNFPEFTHIIDTVDFLNSEQPIIREQESFSVNHYFSTSDNFKLSEAAPPSLESLPSSCPRSECSGSAHDDSDSALSSGESPGDLCRSASSDSSSSTLTSASEKRVLKAASVEATNRKNVLASARSSSGRGLGSPLIQRRPNEEHQVLQRRNSDKTTQNEKQQMIVHTVVTSKPTGPVKVAYIDEICEVEMETVPSPRSMLPLRVTEMRAKAPNTSPPPPPTPEKRTKLPPPIIEVPPPQIVTEVQVTPVVTPPEIPTELPPKSVEEIITTKTVAHVLISPIKTEEIVKTTAAHVNLIAPKTEEKQSTHVIIAAPKEVIQPKSPARVLISPKTEEVIQPKIVTQTQKPAPKKSDEIVKPLQQIQTKTEEKVKSKPTLQLANTQEETITKLKAPTNLPMPLSPEPRVSKLPVIKSPPPTPQPRDIRPQQRPSMSSIPRLSSRQQEQVPTFRDLTERWQSMAADSPPPPTSSRATPPAKPGRRCASVTDVRRALDIRAPAHSRVASLDSSNCEQTNIPLSASMEQLGSVSSVASSTSIISQQELQGLLEEAAAEEGVHSSEGLEVVVLHRDTNASSVGITLAGGADHEARDITVHKVLGGSPAERDGRVHKGDRLLSINGRSMKGLTHREAHLILKAPRPEVVLVVARGRGIDLHDLSPLSPTIMDEVIDPVPQKIEEQNSQSPVLVSLIKDGAGLGFSLEGGKDSPLGDRPLSIKKIFTGGAAEKSGQLRAGDHLFAVNGTDVSAMSRIEAWSLMKRLDAGPVSLLVRHQD